MINSITIKFFFLLFGFFVFTFPLFSLEISGKVIDERYFPVPNIKLTVTGGAISITDNKGEFKIYTDNSVYDIYIYDYASMLGVYYQGLTIANPELVMFGLNSSRDVNNEFLKVEFPPLDRNKNAIIKFLSDEVFLCEDQIATAGETSKMLNIKFPSYKNSINGRVIYLEKTPTDFIKYSEIPITVSKNFYQQSIYFDTLLVSKDPKSSFITIYPPAFAYDSKAFTVYADFISQHRNAELELNNTEGDIISTKVLVPLNLPYGYRLKIEGRGIFKGGEGFVSYTYSYPGSTLNISTETPPRLEAPQDKYWSVNNNTIFSWDWGSGAGFYMVHFHGFNPVGDFYLLTRNKEARFPQNISGGILDGNEYSWEVKKYLTYTSLNDFVRPRQFANDLGYKAVLYSGLRTFRLNPF